MGNLFTVNALPEFQVSPEEHKQRLANHASSCHEFAESARVFSDYSRFDNVSYGTELPDEVAFARNPKWKDLPFGAANTFEKASCGALAPKNALNVLAVRAPKYLRAVFDFHPSVFEVANSLFEKGYRSWQFSNLKGAITSPTVDLNAVKRRHPDNEEVKTCNDEKDLISKFGNPVGIGTSFFFIDNLIKLISCKQDIQIANETRVHSIDQFFSELEKGYCLLVRVWNSTYRDNKTREGGHYVLVTGIEQGFAVIVDSDMEETLGIYKIPAKQLVHSIIYDWRGDKNSPAEDKELKFCPDTAIVWSLAPIMESTEDDVINFLTNGLGISLSTVKVTLADAK